MSFAHQYVHLTEQLQTTERLLTTGLSERAKTKLRETRAGIIRERNNIWDAIMFRVPDDSEGI